MLLDIDTEHPEPWLVARVVQALRRGGVVVLPTDTVYGLACSLEDGEAVRRLYEVKEIGPSKPLAIMVADIATAARYTRGISNPVFRAMRRVLPGPYVFIFQASQEVPRIMLRKRRTIGIRCPDSPVVQAVLEELGSPLLTTSVQNERQEFLLDPVEIDEDVGSRVEMVVSAGVIPNELSTVVDLSGEEPVLVREGKGDVAELGLFQ